MKEIYSMFKDIKKDQDGLDLAQDVLNVVDKIRTHYSNKITQKRLYKK